MPVSSAECEPKLLFKGDIIRCERNSASQRRAHLTLRWRSSTLTELDLSLPRFQPHGPRTDEDTISLLRRLAVHYPDDVIAGILNRQQRKTANGEHPAVFHLHRYIWGRKTARPSVLGHLRFPLAAVFPPLSRGNGELSWVYGKSSWVELGSTTPILPFINSVNQTRPFWSRPMNRGAALLDGMGNSVNCSVLGSNRVM